MHPIPVSVPGCLWDRLPTIAFVAFAPQLGHGVRDPGVLTLRKSCEMSMEAYTDGSIEV